MSSFAVEYVTLDLVRQLAERQGEHLRAIAAYLEANTGLADVGGVVMLALRPKYDEGRTTALEGLAQGQEVCRAVADRAGTARDAYVAADRACLEALRAAAAGTLDVSGIAFHDPAAAPPLAGGPAAIGGGADPLARVTGHDTDLPAWADPAGSGRPAVTTVQTFSEKAAARIRAGAPDPTSAYAIRAPFDTAAKSLVSRFWDSVDNRFGVPGAGSTMRDRYEAHQMARFGAGYDAGYTRFRDPEIHPGGGVWVREGMTTRSVQAGALLVSTEAAVRGAWTNVAALDTAVDRSGLVDDVADGPDNTATIDWARQP